MLGRTAPLCRSWHPSPSPLKAEKAPNINSHVGARQCKAERQFIMVFFLLKRRGRAQGKAQWEYQAGCFHGHKRVKGEALMPFVVPGGHCLKGILGSHGCMVAVHQKPLWRSLRASEGRGRRVGYLQSRTFSPFCPFIFEGGTTLKWNNEG